MSKPSFRMYIDDSGDVSNPASNHPQQRYASITGVIFDIDYHNNKFTHGLINLRKKHFGLLPHGKPPILHLRKIKMAKGPFRCLIEEEARAEWHNDALTMYQQAKYHVITVSVDKIAFYHKNPAWRGSVYELLVGNAIERYFYYLRSIGGSGDVMAEAVNGEFDKILKEMYRRFFYQGTDHIRAQLLQSVLSTNEIKIKAKNKDICGLQMADLLASTCFNHCRRIYNDGPSFDAFAMKVANIIETEKFYRDRNKNPHAYGRVWRP